MVSSKLVQSLAASTAEHRYTTQKRAERYTPAAEQSLCSEHILKHVGDLLMRDVCDVLVRCHSLVKHVCCAAVERHAGQENVPLACISLLSLSCWLTCSGDGHFVGVRYYKSYVFGRKHRENATTKLGSTGPSYYALVASLGPLCTPQHVDCISQQQACLLQRSTATFSSTQKYYLKVERQGTSTTTFTATQQLNISEKESHQQRHQETKYRQAEHVRLLWARQQHRCYCPGHYQALS